MRSHNYEMSDLCMFTSVGGHIYERSHLWEVTTVDVHTCGRSHLWALTPASELLWKIIEPEALATGPAL